MRDAEQVVWDTLQQLDYSWHVFYSARENSGSGYDREVDFVLIRLNRIFYCEVKGGIVHVDQRAGPGVTWAHFTRSGEAIRKRADPKQLWAAKIKLGETIRQIAGQSPRDLGFREHSFYIFPHTPRQVTQGADLERDYFHYAFEEDIATLPTRLQQIVESRKGRFIDHDRIIGIINSLDTMVLREREGMLPQPTKTARQSVHQNWRHAPKQFAPAPMQSDHTVQPRISDKMRPPLWWKPVAVGLCALILLVYFGDSAITSSIWPKVSVSQPKEPESRSRVLPSQSDGAGAGPPSPAPAPKPPTRDPNKALPSFIPAAAASDVERAIAAAQDQPIYVSWRSEPQHGLVILLTTEENGCRRYQVSRHDVQPMKYDTVRRCPPASTPE
jgi:hypothetical protein